jgi:hypothetical protein
MQKARMSSRVLRLVTLLIAVIGMGCAATNKAS